MRRVSTSRLGRQLIHFDGAFEVRVDEYFGMRGARWITEEGIWKEVIMSSSKVELKRLCYLYSPMPAELLCSTPKRHPCLTVDLLRASDWLVVLVLLLADTVLGNDLDNHALEVDGQSSLQLICAHSENLHALLE